MTVRTVWSWVFIALALPLSALAEEWEQIYVQDGVTVSKMDIEGSSLVGFKGDTVYDWPIRAVMHVLMDNEHRIEWVGRLASNHILEQTTPFDYVLYQHFELPVIFSDRDYVYHGVATEDMETGVVTLHMQSIEHADAPPTVGVRANLVNSQYVITPLGDSKTRVEVEIHTDPMGLMPSWLVNLIQRSWPLDTLNGIRGQWGKEHMGEHPLPGDAERDRLAAEEAPADDPGEATEEDAEDAEKVPTDAPRTRPAAPSEDGAPAEEVPPSE